MNAYYALLESAMSRRAFYENVALLVTQNPYFFVLHLEMLDMLESMGKELERQQFLRFSGQKFRELVTDRHLFYRAVTTWTSRDKEDARILARKVVRTEGLSSLGIAGMLATLAISRISALPFPHESRGLRLRLLQQVDAVPLQKELEKAEPWWCLGPERDKILVQRETNTIPLRVLPHYSETFIPRDGPHESVRTNMAQLFPHILAVAEEFAEKEQGGLGTVVLVRLRPRMKVYRHYDDEPHLKGRERYHLVVQSAGGSLMTSGIERRVFKEGDLFFFENHTMHNAANDSDDWRIHMIFDMRARLRS
jgi:hypothetical protein